MTYFLKPQASAKVTRIVVGLILCVALSPLFAAPPEGNYDWSSADKLASGVNHAKFDLTQPRPMKMHAVRIDTTNPRIFFNTTKCDADLGKPMPDCPRFKITTKRTRTLKFFNQARAAGLDMILAVNASPWRPWEKPFNHKYAYIWGFFVVDGVVITPSDTPSPVFVITKDGKVDLRHCTSKSNNSDIAFAIPGFFFILQDGKCCTQDNKTLHPRTFFGLSKDKRYVYFVTVDGRSKGYSEGMTVVEGAAYLKYFGASDAINMDGGGSTTLIFLDPKTKKGRLVNTPPDKSKYTRPVANSVGVCLKKE